MDCDTHASNSGLAFILLFFLQINSAPNLLSYQKHRDTGADQISNGLGCNDAVVAEQSICHNDDGDKHHTLPSQGKNGGTLGVAGGLHQTGADHKDRREGHIDKMPTQVFRADGNNGRVIHKAADKLGCKDRQRQGNRSGKKNLEGIQASAMLYSSKMTLPSTEGMVNAKYALGIEALSKSCCLSVFII